MSSRISVFTFIFLLAALPAVLASIDVITYTSSSSFSLVSGSKELSLCTCQSFVDSFVVSNTGTYANKYQVSHTLPEYVRLSDAGFELLPGESKTVYAYVEAPCDKDISKTLLIEVTDLFGTTKIFEKSLLVSECQNLQATLLSDIASPINPCTPITYSLELTNPGVYTETYTVSFGGDELADKMSSPSQSLILPAGGKGVVKSTLKLGCEFYGNKEVPVHVEALTSGLEADVNHDLQVNRAYDFTSELIVDKLCALDTNAVSLKIANTAAIDNTYSVVLAAPAFISVDGISSPVTVASGEEEIITFSAKPQSSEIGSHPLTLTITSSLGGIVQTITQNVTVDSCHQIRVELVAEDNIKDCSGLKEIPLTISNEGSIDEHVLVTVAGAHAWVEQSAVNVSAGETVDNVLIIEVPEDTSIGQTVTITATLASGSTASDSLGVTFLSDKECYEVALLKSQSVVKYDQLSTEFVLVHKGLEKDTYDISFSGDKWLSLDKEAPSEVSLSPGESTSVKLATYQEETASTLQQYAGVLTLTSSSGSEYNLPLTVKVVQKSFFTRTYEYFSVHKCHFFTLLFTLAIIILAYALILRKEKGGDFKHKGSIFVVAIAVWLLVASFIISTYGMPSHLYDPLPTYEDPLEFAVFENNKLTLDASEYFIDPDNNTLAFSVDADVENITVVSEGSLFTFVPEKDFVGSRRFRFVADDGEENERSQRMMIHVIEKQQYTLWSFYTKYCPSINVLLLLVVVLLVYYSLVWTPAKKRGRKVSNKKN